MTPLGQAAQTRVAKFSTGLMPTSAASHMHTLHLSANILKEHYGDDGVAVEAVAQGVAESRARRVSTSAIRADPGGDGDAMSSARVSGGSNFFRGQSAAESTGEAA